MASRSDMDLAKRLLQAGVLEEGAIRSAFQLQEQWLQQGQRFPLAQVLYAQGNLAEGSLTAALAPSPLETQPFTNYRLTDVLGEGGLAIVYSGVYTPNNTPVAVKVLDPVRALRDLHRERFQHEARLHIDLEHENVVAGYEVGVEGGYHFYTMELVDGLTVLEIVERRGRLTNEEALSITLQTARALEYLHAQGLIHRDIKPGNIVVETSGHARVLDLGLAGQMEGGIQAPMGESTMTVGTVEYLSPEQARGRPDLDARADIYSLGMTLYHMVVGEVAFHGETNYEVMAQQILSSMDTQKIKTRRIDPEIYFLITKMAAKDREERWSSATEAIRMIEGYLPQGIIPVDPGEEPAPPASDAPPVVRPIQSSQAPHRTRGVGQEGAPRRTRGGEEEEAPRRTRGVEQDGVPHRTRGVGQGGAPRRTRGGEEEETPRRTRGGEEEEEEAPRRTRGGEQDGAPHRTRGVGQEGVPRRDRRRRSR